jgi:hypothetical protein
MSPSVGDNSGPVLDEATFQKLLAAAYVMQEHNDRLRDRPSAVQERPETVPVDSDSAAALAQIVDAQHQIHRNNLDLAAAMNLLVDRIRKITSAQGAAICLLTQDTVTYRAANGLLAGQIGSALRPEATLSSSTLLHDTLLRCADTGNDLRVNPEVARRLGVESLIAVPVFHDGKTAGALELAFAKANAFQEHDVRTCQLMAGLVTEALTHAAQEELRKGVAAERASMLEVLERIKPQLARLAQETPPEVLPSAADQRGLGAAAEEDLSDSRCKQCGSELAPGEVFCGACGTSRASVSRNDLQSKWATLWNLKKVSDRLAAVEGQPSESVLKPADPFSPATSASDLPTSASLASDSPAEGSSVLKESPITAIPEHSEPAISSESEAAAVAPVPPFEVAVSPAAAPQGESAPPQAVERPEWLQSVAVSPPAVQLKGFWQKHQGFIRRHPGDLALGVAAVLFLITIFWAVSSDNPTTSADSGNAPAGATANAASKPKKKQAPPAPKLSMFDQLLVDLGLAEAPPAESYMGNPNVPVWVDVHTGLYYCPGTDLYGKTQQGKIASQHDAQLDQFEPASRKVCD